MQKVLDSGEYCGACKCKDKIIQKLREENTRLLKALNWQTVYVCNLQDKIADLETEGMELAVENADLRKENGQYYDELEMARIENHYEDKQAYYRGALR